MTIPINGPVVGPYPDAAQIADAVRRLSTRDGTYAVGYPFTCGVLGQVVKNLAARHAGCIRPHCGTCWHLRAGLAALAAIEERERR